MRSLLAILAVAGIAVPLPAQMIEPEPRARLHLEAMGLFASMGGSDFHNVSGGPGAEAQLRLQRGSVSLGVGAQWSSHPILFQIRRGQHWSHAGVFVSPRYAFAEVHKRGLPRTRAFVGLRGGWLHRSVSAPAGRLSGDGWTAGAETGAAFILTDAIQAQLSLSAVKVVFGDTWLDHVRGPDTGAEGAMLSLRGGFAILLR